MTKLKTLKDIEACPCQEVFLDLAKAEAIKHIKELEREKGENVEWTLLYNPTKEEIEQVINYIKWANNITEEDLK